MQLAEHRCKVPGLRNAQNCTSCSFQRLPRKDSPQGQKCPIGDHQHTLDWHKTISQEAAGPCSLGSTRSSV